jgi:hypothetical protein
LSDKLQFVAYADCRDKLKFIGQQLYFADYPGVVSIRAIPVRPTYGAKPMKYILLVHHDEQVLGDLSDSELQGMRQESVALANQINSKGQYVDAAPLHPTSTATCVRVREGRRLVTDGPFAETREQLGGYFLVNAGNLDEAIAIAGQVPGARIGTVEIRPVVELSGLP